MRILLLPLSIITLINSACTPADIMIEAQAAEKICEVVEEIEK